MIHRHEAQRFKGVGNRGEPKRLSLQRRRGSHDTSGGDPGRTTTSTPNMKRRKHRTNPRLITGRLRNPAFDEGAKCHGKLVLESDHVPFISLPGRPAKHAEERREPAKASQRKRRTPPSSG